MPASPEVLLAIESAARRESYKEIVELLRESLNHSDNVSAVLKAISTLAEDVKGCSELSQYGACESVTASMKVNPSKYEVALFGCQSIRHLAQGGANGRKLNQCNACEVVINAIRTFPDKADMVTPACDTICNLALGGAISKDFLWNTSKAVISTLNIFTTNTVVTQYGCKAIFYLGNGSANLEVLGQCGACQAVITSMKSFPNDANVIEWCCRAMSVLAQFNENRIQFVQLKVFDILIGVLKTFPSINTVMEWSCRAIANIAEYEAPYSAFENPEACKYLPSIVSAAADRNGLTDRDVTEWGCLAMGKLALNAANSTRLGGFGACEAIVKSLHTFQDIDDVAASGCFAIIQMCDENKENLQHFRKQDALKIVEACADNAYRGDAIRVLKEANSCIVM